MSQPTKPTSYLRVAAKILRTLNRSNDKKSSTKPKDSTKTTSSSISESFTSTASTTSSFQHSNGRRLSYSHHHPASFQHHHQTYRTEKYDSPLYTLQRRRNTDSTLPAPGTIKAQHCTTAAKTTPKDVLSFPSPTRSMTTVSASKTCRQSGSPTIRPLINSHYDVQHTPTSFSPSASVSSSTSLSRSNSLPNYRRKQIPSQIATLPLSQQQQQKQQQRLKYQSAMAPTIEEGNLAQTAILSQDIAFPISTKAQSNNCNNDSEILKQEQCNIYYKPVGTPRGPAKWRRSDDSKTIASSRYSNSPMSVSVPSSASMSPVSPISPMFEAPSRSMTNTSLRSGSSSSSEMSSVSAGGMLLVDSGMSIHSHLSESSMFPVAMTVNGLPSMDAMMDQVDKSLATDSQAQLVENAHVGLVSHVTFVDTRLIAEPCSATIETWVN